MMAQGSTNGDEPQNAVIFTCILTQVFICIGDLDVIAPICTSFFCLAYAAVNFTCFLLQVTGVPNFRPTFKYHSWHLSLIGAVLNIGVMIYLNAIYAVISLLVLCCLFLYLYLTAPSTSWGDISQALIFHQVRKYLLRLDVRKAHSKFWRPSVLLLTTQVEKAQMDVILCNSLKKGGLYVIGNVVEGPFCQVTNLKRTEQSQAWMSYLSDSNLKAIPQIVVAKDEIEGYRALMQTAGIGGMQINTVVLPWIDSLLPTQESRYVGLILDALLLKKHAVVLRHTDKVDARFLTHQPTGLKEMNNSFARENTIDVWFMKEELVDSSFEKNPVSQFSTLSCTSTAALMLQLAYVLYSNKAWKKKCKIRLIKLSNSHDSKIMQQERMRLEQVAEELRIDVGDILIVPWNPLPNYFPETPTLTGPTIKEYFDQEIGVTEMNKTIQRYSMGTAQIILPLPHPTKYTNSHDTCKNYVSRLDLLTKNLPSTMLILSEDDTCVISTCI
jgi:potassium/chloride transporter 9